MSTQPTELSSSGGPAAKAGAPAAGNSAAGDSTANKAAPGAAATVPPRRFSRRKMLALGGAMLAAGTGYYYAQRYGVNVALVGAGGRGDHHAAVLKWLRYGTDPYGKVLAICDVHLDKAKALRDAYWSGAQVCQDYREVLKNNDIQAVYVVTNNHWHAEIAIDAMKAGKAVYLEKPISLTIEEGFRLRDVAKQTGAVVQVGTQQRSHTPFHTAWELVRNGRLGKLQKIVVSLSTQPPPTGLDSEPAAPPQALDWDFWLGPTPTVPYCEYRYKGWGSMADYSGGMMTNWGSHHMDIALWVSGDDNSYPLVVDGTGTTPTLPVGTGVPSDFSVALQYASGIPYEIKTTPKDHGILFQGDAGKIFVNRARVSGKPVEDLAANPLPADAVRVGARKWPGPKQRLAEMQHSRDFIDCIRTGDTPIADINSAVCVHTALHLANLSIALNRPLHFDPQTLQIENDPEAAALTSRDRRPGFAI
jgi:myo-inositol 2-dehydrogenase / D-chiro-inositol 1-dehydrogenase